LACSYSPAEADYAAVRPPRLTGAAYRSRAPVRAAPSTSTVQVAELAGHGAGWQAHVEDLATHVAGREPGDWRSRWTALTPVYEAITRDLA